MEPRPRDNPYIWTTWLPQMMLGDSTCRWSLWHMANFDFERAPDDKDWTQWRADHTQLVEQLALEEEAKGNSLSFESQAAFRFRGPSGLTLHGKPDIVSRSRSEATVIEAKVGKVRDGHVWQAKIYMYALPRSLPEYREIEIHGRVAYPDGHRIEIHSSAIDESFERTMNHWLEMATQGTPPRRVPSEDNCRFCKISVNDCRDRIGSDTVSDEDW